MKVKATKKGFDGTGVREPGDVFDMPEGSKASWFEPVEKQPDEKKDVKKGEDKKSLA